MMEGRSSNPPFKSISDAVASPEFGKTSFNIGAKAAAGVGRRRHDTTNTLMAREALMTNLLKVMAGDNGWTPSCIKLLSTSRLSWSRWGIDPPYVLYKGTPHLNTFLVFVPVVVVPAGFTRDNLPAGIRLSGTALRRWQI